MRVLIVLFASLFFVQEEDPPEYLNDWRFDEVITNVDFQNQLELSNEQRLKIVAAESRLKRQMVDGVMAIERKGGEADLQAAQEHFINQLSSEIGEIMLPFQVERSRQLLLWNKLNDGGIKKLIEFGPVQRELNLTRGERSELIRNEKRTSNKFQDELEKLQTKYRKKALKAIGKENARKLKEKAGESSFVEMPRIRF